MRLTWNSKKIELEPIELIDVKAIITDKDGTEHTRVFESDWLYCYFDHDVEIRLASQRADYYLAKNEYVTVDGGLRIPRCNIKSVKYEVTNTRKVTPFRMSYGIKDWDSFHWFFFLMGAGAAGVVALLTGLYVYFEIIAK